jgi:hypothetical protein
MKQQHTTSWVAQASGLSASASRRCPERRAQFAQRTHLPCDLIYPTPNFGGTPQFTPEPRVPPCSALRAPHSAFH